MVVKKGETGTYVKWLQQGLHITMIIGCSSLFNFIVKNFDYPEKTLKYKHIRRISD